MRIIVGLERSGIIRRALRDAGHEAYSNDLVPADDGSEFHLQMDVREAIAMGGWDAGIFHPVCRILANSGSKHLYKGMRKENGPNAERWAALREAVDLFLACWNADIPRVAVENPIIHRHARELIGVGPTQIIQPWMHGHPESKGTGLWLRHLPPLMPTNIVWAEMMARSKKDRNRIHYMPPSADRERLRSETYPGIAAAMVSQWFTGEIWPWEAVDLFDGMDVPSWSPEPLVPSQNSFD